MKKITLVLIMGFIAFSGNCQLNKNLVLGISAGSTTSPYYSNNKLGTFYNLNIDYGLSARNILSVNYDHGAHRYFDNIVATGSIKANGTNADAAYRTFSVLYKYQFLKKMRMDGAVGAGAGIMTHVKKYPSETSTGSAYQQSAWSDLVFPVKIELNYHISHALRIGVTGGFFIHPDFPILAYHLGPGIRYSLR